MPTLYITALILINLINKELIFIEKIGSYGRGFGEFILPNAIAVDKPGNILYVSDSGNKRIYKFDRKKKTVEIIYRGKHFKSICIKDNFLYGITACHRIIKLTCAGKMIKRWGRWGLEPGSINDGSSIISCTIDGNEYIYILDNNDRVSKFDIKGRFISSFCRHGSHNEGLDCPLSIEVDKFNNFYIADSNNNCIKKYSPSFKFIKKIGEEILINPCSLAISNNNTLLVGTLLLPYIYEFTLEGKLLNIFDLRRNDKQIYYVNPVDIHTDMFGHIYVVDKYRHRVLIYKIKQ